MDIYEIGPFRLDIYVLDIYVLDIITCHPHAIDQQKDISLKMFKHAELSM